MKKNIPNKAAIEDSYDLFERFIRYNSNEYRPHMAIRFLMCLMDGPKTRDEIAEFIDSTSASYKRGKRLMRSNKHTLSNVSRIAKRLHEGNTIRIIYNHPKHDSPFSENGKLRLGASATYQLSEESSQFIRGWLYRCFMSLDGPFYESEKNQDGELIYEYTDKSGKEYYITNIDEKGNVIKTKLTP